MSIQRMDHVGIVVDDLAAATEFFAELARRKARVTTSTRRRMPRVSAGIIIELAERIG